MPVPDTSTNAAMAAADIAGIIRVAALEIVIDGNVFHHYESFHLEQSASATPNPTAASHVQTGITTNVR